MSQFGQNMMIVKSTWRGVPNFTLIPVKDDCPFVECIFEPSTASLVIFSKHTRQMLRMIEKVGPEGDPVLAKKKRENGSRFAEERKTIDCFLEHYITDPEDLREFIEAFAVNPGKISLDDFLKKSEAKPEPKQVG